MGLMRASGRASWERGVWVGGRGGEERGEGRERVGIGGSEGFDPLKGLHSVCV